MVCLYPLEIDHITIEMEKNKMERNNISKYIQKSINDNGSGWTMLE